MEALRDAVAVGSVTLVGSQSGLGIGLGPGEEGGLRLAQVLLLPGPRLERALLQRAPEGEGQAPRLLAHQLVHGVQVERGLLLTLSPRKEHDGRHGGGHRPLERPHGVLGHHGRRHLGRVRPGGHHVGLQQGAFQEHVVVVERLVHGGQHLLCDGSTDLDAVGPVDEDLRLDDGYEAVLLANDGVPGEAVGVLGDGEEGGLGGPDLEDGAPLGEAGAGLVVLSAALAQVVEALRGGLAIGASELDGTLVDLDAREHVTLIQHVHEGLAGGGLLVESFLEEDDAAQVLQSPGSGEQEFAESAPVRLHVLHVDAREPLADCTRRLVRRQDPLARGSDVRRVLDQLICPSMEKRIY